MNTRSRDETSIAAQAAEWFTKLEEDRASDRAAFAEWITRSPLHVQEFLHISAVHRMFEKVDPERRLNVEAMLERGTDQVARVPGWVAGSTRRISLRSHRRTGLAAAAACLALAAAWGYGALDSGQRYTTVIGEQRSVALTDGSLVHLNTDSEVAVSFNARARDVRLDEGEALFDVAKDPQHPFRVHAGDILIQAIGTQFNVRLDSRETKVSVVEGTVAVTDTAARKLELRAGEAARMGADGRLIARGTVDPARATAWRQRRLVFDEDTLADMAAEFKRYNRSLKIRIEGAGVAERRFTGTLDADDPESLLRILAEADDLVSRREDGQIVIRAR